jgi:hypothetical protein
VLAKMPSKVTGDFSKLPDEIREVFPYFYGEACELQIAWRIYHSMFMSGDERTRLLGTYLGPLLGRFQILQQNEIFMAIGRLTDRDHSTQKNFSLWALVDAYEKWDPRLGAELRSGVERLYANVKDIRQHRHKRLAHYDLGITLEVDSLPEVRLGELREAIEEIAALINQVARSTGFGSILFEVLDGKDSTWPAEMAVYKAKAYDALVETGRIDWKEWEKHRIDPL